MRKHCFSPHKKIYTHIQGDWLEPHDVFYYLSQGSLWLEHKQDTLIIMPQSVCICCLYLLVLVRAPKSTSKNKNKIKTNTKQNKKNKKIHTRPFLPHRQGSRGRNEVQHELPTCSKHEVLLQQW